MIRARLPRRAALSAVLTLFVAFPSLPALAQQGGNPATATKSSGKKTLTLADYGRWNRIQSSGLSSEGNGLPTRRRPTRAMAGTLYIKDLDGRTVHTVPVAVAPSSPMMRVGLPTS